MQVRGRYWGNGVGLWGLLNEAKMVHWNRSLRFVQATRRDFSISQAKKNKTVKSCPDNLHLVCVCIIYNLFLLKTGVSLHVFKVLLRCLSPERLPPSMSPLRLWNFKIKAHRHVYGNLVPHIIFLHTDWLWSPSCTMPFQRQQLYCCLLAL